MAGRQLGSNDHDKASITVNTTIGMSVIIGIILCIGGIICIEPLLKSFGASLDSLYLAMQYAFWMFIAALANLPAQCMNCAARAESSVKITSFAAILFFIMAGFYLSSRSIIKIRLKSFKPSFDLIKPLL